MNPRSLALLFLAVCAAPIDLSGQLQDAGPLVWRADVTGVTRYSWRGIQMNERFALQPDLALGYAHNGYSVSAGGRASGDSKLDDLLHEYFQELDVWGQVAVRQGGVTAALGAMRFWYRVPSLEAVHTTEAYGLFRWQTGRWAPAVQAWSGVQGVHGVYFEPSLTRHHIANPFAGPGASLSSKLSAGFQLGDRNPDSPLIPGPVRTGLAFVELATVLRVALDLGPVTLVSSFGPALRFNRDPTAKLQPDGSSDKVHLSWPLQIGVALPGRNRQ
ncbi:MAG: hypothetical protein ABI836_04280 [Gemmatimonadota bacterium]